MAGRLISTNNFTSFLNHSTCSGDLNFCSNFYGNAENPHIAFLLSFIYLRQVEVGKGDSGESIEVVQVDRFFPPINEAHSFSYLKMPFRTHTCRQLVWGFPVFHCTQTLGEWPLLIPLQRPTPTPLFVRTFQTTSRTSDRSFTKLLIDANNPPVQVSSISDKRYPAC